MFIIGKHELIISCVCDGFYVLILWFPKCASVRVRLQNNFSKFLIREQKLKFVFMFI